MAKGGLEMTEFGRPEDSVLDEGRVETTDVDEGPTVDILTEDKTCIHKLETALETYNGEILAEQWERLKETKVDAYLKVVAERIGLLPKLDIYDEFYLGKDGRMLYLKNGTRVTHLKDSTKYRTLKSIASADYIRTHLFPDYMTGQHDRTLQPPQRKSLVSIKSLATQATVENTEPGDLPQHASDIDTVVKQLFTESGTNTDGLPIRDLLGLDEALRRHRSALVDNLAKLHQLDGDIANAEHELNGEEAAADPAKKSRIEQLLSRLHDERATRLEAASVNREALRSQISRIRETVTRILNDDTTLAERLRTLFREQGVTIASLLTALGFIISTVVLTIQNTLGGVV